MFHCFQSQNRRLPDIKFETSLVHAALKGKWKCFKRKVLIRSNLVADFTIILFVPSVLFITNFVFTVIHP